jgi:L-lactate dehydrogenase complex protein LldG
MTDARSDILQAIARATHALPKQSAQPAPSLVPTDYSQQVALTQFIQKAEAAKTRVIRVKDLETISSSMPLYLEECGQSSLFCAGALADTLQWPTLFQSAITDDPMQLSEGAALVQGQFGLSETGTVVCCSSGDAPSNALFLPQDLFLVLHSNAIVFDLAQAYHALGNAHLPRMVNCITGPSCTADIEQELLYGAHGPKTLTLFLVD